MTYQDDIDRPNTITIRQLAAILGLTPENIRALERRGRLPEGCDPEVDLVSGTRYWTPKQVKRLKQWNDERQRVKEEEEALRQAREEEAFRLAEEAEAERTGENEEVPAVGEGGETAEGEQEAPAPAAEGDKETPTPAVESEEEKPTPAAEDETANGEEEQR